MPGPHHILAVDDNPRNLLIIERALGDAFELVTCGSGEEAIEIAPRFRPGVILLDLMMTGIDGYETCRRLRAMPVLMGSKIIMVSARATAADRLEGYQAGADDYVTKPFDPDELVAKLRVYLRLKSIEEVDRLKSELLQLLSHETRTPLSSILAPATLLLEDPSLGEGARKMARMIHTSGKRLLDLVERVAYLSQLKSGGSPRHSERLDPEVPVQMALSRFAPLAAEADVELVLERTASPLMIDANAAQLGVAIDAILDNAIRLSPRSSCVRISTHPAKPWFELRIRDHGPGIPAEFADRVFREFAVVDLAHHHAGHGLGLATARWIVEQHGGSLAFQNEPDGGATFRLRLPYVVDQERAA